VPLDSSHVGEQPRAADYSPTRQQLLRDWASCLLPARSIP
jgi:hypothetical protein